MTALLLALIIVLAIAGAEFVRSTCRRQLTAPIVARPQLQHADLD